MTMFRRLLTLAGLGFAVLLLQTAVAGDEQDAWKRLNSYFDELVTLTADFEQTLLDDAGEVVQVSSGLLALDRPGKFRWDYTDPYEQLIVSDGAYVWLYDADLEQVTVRVLDETLANTPAMLLGGDSQLTERFSISETVRRDGSEWITLVPRVGDTDFKTVILEFDQAGLSSMRLADTLDQITEIRFSNLLRNPEVDPALFGFEPPDGVDVIGNIGGDRVADPAQGGT